MVLPVRSISRKATPVFFWTTVLVLAFVAVVECHELIPFLQMEVESSDSLQLASVCPFCQIMFTLALAVFFFFHLFVQKRLRLLQAFKVYFPQLLFVGGLFDPRAPPSL